MFCFPLPIGWQELSAIATTIAVIIALFANKKTSEQLQKSLQMHEQSKNISFYEKRIDIFKRMMENKANNVDEVDIEILFNKDILDMIALKNKILNDISDQNYLIDEYFNYLNSKGAYNLTIEELRMLYAENLEIIEKYPEYESQFIKKCKKDEVCIDGTTYNFYELNKNLSIKIKELENINKKLDKMAKQFIKDSIKKIS